MKSFMFVVLFVILCTSAYGLPEPVLPDGLTYEAQIAWGPEADGLVWKDIPIVDFVYRPGIPYPHSYDSKSVGPSEVLWWEGIPPAPYNTPERRYVVRVGIRIGTIEGPVPWMGFYRARFRSTVYGVAKNWSQASDWTLVTDLSKIPFLERAVNVGKSFVAKLHFFS